jgi:Asp-tRNA(Asn)/Glu-tRNA(Gln) amidotransferase A subunit family amidase
LKRVGLSSSTRTAAAPACGYESGTRRRVSSLREKDGSRLCCTQQDLSLPASATFSGRRLYDFSRYCRFVNILGLPTLTVHVGFDDHGLPVALQVIGRRGRDPDLIALAARMQKNSDWHARVPDAIHDLIDADDCD